jgi:hypothetical protein
MPASFAHVE